MFHHIGEKEREISDLVCRSSWEKVVEELKQCISLCANCHAIVHYEERNQGKD